MRRLVSFLLLALFLPAATGHAGEMERPKLVVGIVVDQMRWDFLTRLSAGYSDKGFRRLLAEGYSCNNTQINYASTITACGHASIYTGSIPAIHGITGNNFTLQSSGKRTYCTSDDSVQTVGAQGDAGKMSPRNLLATTIGDELRLATNSRARVFAVAIKDRGAILPGGHMANGVYWYDETGDGAWITSTYYRDTLPDWVAKFNQEKTAASYLKGDWTPLPETLVLGQSTPDDVPYEIPLEKDGRPVLPLKTSALPKQADIIPSTPFGNTMTLDFARALIAHERLGSGDTTDFLAISLSSPDYVGHLFGPNSVEIVDTYLRLDRELGDFLADLDQTVGRGNYLVFLTADHGVAHNVKFLEERKIPSGLWSGSLTGRMLDTFLQSKFGQSGLVLRIENNQVNLNNPLIQSAQLDETAVTRAAVDFLKQRDGVAAVLAMGSSTPLPDIPEPIRSRVINAFHPERSGSIQIILKPGWYDKSLPQGTTHGTWSPYDAHIPLVWMGWRIPHGETWRETAMSDIAPTLAALLKIQIPNGTTGQPIPEILAPLSP